MKRKLALIFSLLSVLLFIGVICFDRYYPEYLRQTFRPIFPLVLFLRPAAYFCFGIALTLLAFKELSVGLFRKVLLFSGMVLVMMYLLVCLCLLTGMSLGVLMNPFIFVMKYPQLFFIPGILIGIGLNHSPQE